MSVYRCTKCELYKDTDHEECNENPKDPYSCLCEGWVEECGCFRCGKFNKDTKYCKESDLYFCEGCA